MAILVAVRAADGMPQLPDGMSASGIVLFIGIFPLLNALADFASIGLTRWWLRKGLEGHLQRATTFDFIAALAIFALLGMSIISVIHWVRPQDGVALLDLSALFTDLRCDPGDYWWLGFMLFSTLIPTLMHLIVALFAFFALYPERLRLWIAEELHRGGQGDVLAARHATLALSGLASLAVFVPAFALVEGLGAFPQIVARTIDFFDRFARLIGAIPENLPPECPVTA